MWNLVWVLFFVTGIVKMLGGIVILSNIVVRNNVRPLDLSEVCLGETVLDDGRHISVFLSDKYIHGFTRVPPWVAAAITFRPEGMTDRIIVNWGFLQVSTQLREFILQHEKAHVLYRHLDGFCASGGTGIMLVLENELQADAYAFERIREIWGDVDPVAIIRELMASYPGKMKGARVRAAKKIRKQWKKEDRMEK